MEIAWATVCDAIIRQPPDRLAIVSPTIYRTFVPAVPADIPLTIALIIRFGQSDLFSDDLISHIIRVEVETPGGHTEQMSSPLMLSVVRPQMFPVGSDFEDVYPVHINLYAESTGLYWIRVSLDDVQPTVIPHRVLLESEAFT